jgi:hypothetical protein
MYVAVLKCLIKNIVDECECKCLLCVKVLQVPSIVDVMLNAHIL